MSSGPGRNRHDGDYGPSFGRETERRWRSGLLHARPEATSERTTSGAKALTEATGDAGYDELGEPLKASITHKEWQWLSDREKGRLIQSMTEPEVFDDGA